MSDYNMNEEQFEKYCQNHTAKEVATLLHNWVTDGQPDGLLNSYSSRAMCSFVTECMGDRYGGYWNYMDFYNYMWGCGNEPMDESEADSRKARHIRCGLIEQPHSTEER